MLSSMVAYQCISCCTGLFLISFSGDWPRGRASLRYTLISKVLEINSSSTVLAQLALGFLTYYRIIPVSRNAANPISRRFGP